MNTFVKLYFYSIKKHLKIQNEYITMIFMDFHERFYFFIKNHCNVLKISSLNPFYL